MADHHGNIAQRGVLMGMETEITVVGAGLVGLACARSLARKGRRVLVLEQHSSFGRETSSRNSQVIHAGIYYPAGSLKGRLCVEGNRMLYSICAEHRLPHRNCGKLIVAVNEKEEEQLPGLLELGRGVGAEGLEIISTAGIRRREPHVYGRAALWCPTSGIVDTHALMQYYAADAGNHGAEIAYRTRLEELEWDGTRWRVGVTDAHGEPFRFASRLVVNAAGLGAPAVAAAAGMDIAAAGYELHYAKGVYFSVSPAKAGLTGSLIYPVPPRPGSVGIHTVPDLGGGMKLGPYDVWVDEVEYSVDPGLRTLFYKSTKPFLPFLEPEDLHPDMAGIHPKVQRPGEPLRDFIVRHEADRGLPGLINLVGIESPGVTASAALGEMVAGMVADLV